MRRHTALLILNYIMEQTSKQYWSIKFVSNAPDPDCHLSNYYHFNCHLSNDHISNSTHSNGDHSKGQHSNCHQLCVDF